jgi:hypothetical protein
MSSSLDAGIVVTLEIKSGERHEIEFLFSLVMMAIEEGIRER